MLKVRGGTLKNKTILEPSKEITRPSKDILKQGLFNILRNYEISSFLDLFSGSGQIAIEAYSLGYKNIYLNELNKDSYKTILKNLSNLNIKDIKTFNLDYLDFIEKNTDLKFDCIFIDPPYKMDINLEFMLNIEKISKDNSLIFIERDTSLEKEIESRYNIKEYKYGRSKLYLLKKI